MASAETRRDEQELHRLPFEPPSSALSRALLHEFTLDMELSAAVMQEAVIVLGELVANALDHGRPRTDGCFEVGFEHVGGELRIWVEDGGDGRPRVIDAAPYAERGRGLAMVEALCSTWLVERQEGTRVSAVLSIT